MFILVFSIGGLVITLVNFLGRMYFINIHQCIYLLLMASFENNVLTAPSEPTTDSESPVKYEKNKRITHRDNQDGVIYFRCIQNGTIALTFDDGPAKGPTDEIVDLLRELNVKATFFVVGLVNNLDEKSDLFSIEDQNSQITLRRTLANGHAIGHHTWSHHYPGLVDLNETGVVQEMNLLTEAIIRIIGFPLKFMRPPYGEYNDEVIRIINGDLGFKVIMWSIDTNDWRHPGDTQAGLAEYVKVLNGTDPSLTPGFIALHHDKFNGSSELANATIEYSRSLGYRYVTLAECIGLI